LTWDIPGHYYLVIGFLASMGLPYAVEVAIHYGFNENTIYDTTTTMPGLAAANTDIATVRLHFL